MPIWWAKARKSNKKVPTVMRQFHSFDATNLAAAAKKSGKKIGKAGLYQIKSFDFKVAHELLNYLESMTKVSQEKTKWQ